MIQNDEIRSFTGLSIYDWLLFLSILQVLYNIYRYRLLERI